MGEPSHKYGWIITGMVLTFAAIGSLTLVCVIRLTTQTEVQHEVYHHQTSRVVVKLGTGDVTLRQGDADTVVIHRTLKWAFSEPQIHETWTDGVLNINPSCGSVVSTFDCSVSYAILVPSDVIVEVTASTGDIDIDNFQGSLSLSVSTGDITVMNYQGSLSAMASTGDITGADLRSANITASTSMGDVLLRCSEAPSSITAKTTMGDVDITVPSGDAYQVTTSTNTGDETIGVTRDDYSERIITAATTTGDITLRQS